MVDIRSSVDVRSSAVTKIPTSGSGMLSGGGSSLVHLLISDPVFVNELEPHWREHVTAVRDNHGHTVDWLPRPGTSPELREEFLRLRGRYQQERLLADTATVRAFLGWAQPRLNVSALRVLRLPHGRIDAPDLAKAAFQATAAGRLAREDAGGLGLYATGRGGLVRGFVAGPHTVLLADGAAEIYIDSGSVCVSAGSVRRLPLSGWNLETDSLEPIGVGPIGVGPIGAGPTGVELIGVELIGLDGARTHADPHLAAMLNAVAMGVRAVTVRPASLGQVFAGITSGVAELARVAERRHAPLLISSGLPLVQAA